MHCGMTKDYNTGWKLEISNGATSSDTDDTNITGQNELVTNGVLIQI